MKLSELFESNNTQSEGRAVVIYPGRFQPPTPGHIWGYKTLVGKFGRNNVYIAMTGYTDPEKSPLSYDDRKLIFTKLLGVPEDKIIKVSNQYNTDNVKKVIDLNKQTALIFAISQKDMNDNPRFKFTQDSYMQDFHNRKSLPILEPYTEHAYIMTFPTRTFSVGTGKANSATRIRKLFRTLDTAGKKRLFIEIYGKFDASTFEILRQIVRLRVVGLRNVLGTTVFPGRNRQPHEPFYRRDSTEYRRNRSETSPS